MTYEVIEPVENIVCERFNAKDEDEAVRLALRDFGNDKHAHYVRNATTNELIAYI